MSNDVTFEISKEATDQIIEQGYDVSFGARPLKRFIQHSIETMIAKTIISQNIKPNSTLVVDAKGEELQVNVK